MILDRHASEVYRFALHLCGNQPDADDLYQEMALKAYRAFGRLSPDANYRAWLYRICSNTFLSDRRKLNRISPLDDRTAETLPAGETDDAARLDAQHLLVDVERIIEQLPPKQRIALVARKYHDLGYDCIAEMLGSSEAAARANVHEAVRKLRLSLGDRLN